MGMENLYREVMDLNMMDDNDRKRDVAKAFFEKLNFMELPEYFNWAAEIFEGMHVKERGDKTALIWADIVTTESKSYSYQDFSFHGNQCLNALRKAGVEKGNNMYHDDAHRSGNLVCQLRLHQRWARCRTDGHNHDRKRVRVQI